MPRGKTGRAKRKNDKKKKRHDSKITTPENIESMMNTMGIKMDPRQMFISLITRDHSKEISGFNTPDEAVVIFHVEERTMTSLFKEFWENSPDAERWTKRFEEFPHKDWVHLLFRFPDLDVTKMYYTRVRRVPVEPTVKPPTRERIPDSVIEEVNEEDEDNDDIPIMNNDENVKFEASDTFQGDRPGFIFKTGSQGTGYYEDINSQVDSDSTDPVNPI